MGGARLTFVLALGLVAALAPRARACPVCDSPAGGRVRDAIVRDLAAGAAATALPFAVAGAAAWLLPLAPRRKEERRHD